MEQVRFIFWELLRILGLVLTSLLAVKTVASRKAAKDANLPGHAARANTWLYAVILALAGLGAWTLGYDVAAEAYFWVSLRDAQNSRMSKAYLNSLHAVELRPGVPRYWKALEVTKFNLGQWASVVDDWPAVERLAGREFDAEGQWRLAASLFFVGRYDEALSITRRIILQDRFYLAPYILQGNILTAQRRYAEAQQAFAAALELRPTDQAAVEGLAHADFLEGNRQQALKVLEDAPQLSFSIEARKRFEALEGLYGQ